MDGPGIDQKIRFGYAKAAAKLGQSFDLYRSATLINPLDSGNLVGSLLMVASQDWTWMKGNRPGNAIWYVCVDGQDSSYPLSATEGDYLVNDKTFFILSKEYQMPMQAVECNKVVNIIRPYQSTAAGWDGNYGGYQESTSTLIGENIPISCLLLRMGSKADSKFPTDTSQPTWTVLLPNLGDENIRTGDILQGISDIGSYSAMGLISDEERFVVSGSEETEFGWRLTCTQVMN